MIISGRSPLFICFVLREMTSNADHCGEPVEIWDLPGTKIANFGINP